MKQRQLLFHLLALLTVSIWGVTFVSTKILIGAGLTPTEIFILRFALAYLCIIAVSHSRLWSDSIKDELLMCVAGLTGGSLYFIAENSALAITLASDVSLLICTAPIFTMLLGRIFLHVPLRQRMAAGSLIALCGVGLVVLNGTLNLGLNPLGDALTLAAALLWAAYCIVLKMLGQRYHTLFITRKVFFYGLLSSAIFLAFEPRQFDPHLLLAPAVYGNLLFLSIVASMLGYIMWNRAVKSLGAEKTANYIYCIPLVTILAAVLFLGEPFTVHTAIGAALIIGGVVLAEK